MRKNILLLFASLLPLATFATDAAPVASSDHSSVNTALIGLVSLVVVLMAAIGLLANVMKQLAFAVRDKEKQEIKSGSTIAKTTLLLLVACTLAFSSFAQEVKDKAAEAVAAAPASPYISGISTGDFYFILGIIAFELVVLGAILYQIRGFVRLLRNIPDSEPLLNRILRINLLDYFNKSVAVKEESTILLDHDYDGIHELDNSLPPWWKYGFILTIIFSGIYLWYYHAGGGPSQEDEYIAAVQKGEEEKAAYLAKAGNKIDETNITMVLDPAELTNAQTLFKNTCAACHSADGGGNVGPNLTDDYWLHGGSIQDVFKSIKYGWKDKGMPEWQANMNPKQLAGLASYVKSLKGTHPAAPKPAQGELFVKGGDKAIDSVGSKTEPTLDPSGKKENKDKPLAPFKKERRNKGLASK